MYKWLLWNGKKCKHWSDCSFIRNSLIWVYTVCPGLLGRTLSQNMWLCESIEQHNSILFGMFTRSMLQQPNVGPTELLQRSVTACIMICGLELLESSVWFITACIMIWHHTYWQEASFITAVRLCHWMCSFFYL